MVPLVGRREPLRICPLRRTLPPMAQTRLEHPNRDKAESKATRAAVVLLLISAALLVVVTLGGFSEQQAWNVEVEVHDDDYEYGGYEGWPRTA